MSCDTSIRTDRKSIFDLHFRLPLRVRTRAAPKFPDNGVKKSGCLHTRDSRSDRTRGFLGAIFPLVRSNGVCHTSRPPQHGLVGSRFARAAVFGYCYYYRKMVEQCHRPRLLRPQKEKKQEKRIRCFCEHENDREKNKNRRTKVRRKSLKISVGLDSFLRSQKQQNTVFLRRKTTEK